MTLYDRRHYDRTEPIGSYWEATGGPEPEGLAALDGDRTAEVAIVGGGYAGLSTAWHLAREHGIEAVVLEAGPVGWGGSGRNGGFCCLGGDKLGTAAVAARFGRDEARRWHEVQKAGIARVAEIAAENAIDFQRAGEGEWLVAHRPGRVDRLRASAATVRDILGETWPVFDEAALKERFIDAPEAHGGMFVPHGFGLHPMRWVRGLAAAVAGAGIALHPRTTVTAMRREGDGWRLSAATGSVTARRVLVTGNGYLDERLHAGLAGRPLPALSSIVVTRPLTLGERTAHRWQEPALMADRRNLVFYIRMLPDHRLLFGARGGTDASPPAFARRIAWMRRRLGERFPAWREVAIEHAWWGLVALARDRHVHLSPLDDGVMTLWGCHGSGVALMTGLGQVAATLLAGREPNMPTPAFIRRPAPAFPLPALRVPYLRGAYAWYGLRDEWLP